MPASHRINFVIKRLLAVYYYLDPKISGPTMNSRRTLFALAFLTAGIFTHCLGVDTQAQDAVPRFEPSDCAIPIPKDETPVCGYVVVPENRTIRNGRTIRLPIIIQKSNSPGPKPDPLLRTFGGPGASSLNMMRGRKTSPWLNDRDLIIFEQRGTKYAQPALECPEVDGANISSAKKHLDARSARTNELNAAKACYDRLKSSGIDLSGYNSRESAADIEDVRRVLKYDKINLYGVSYSSRLMLNVIRDHPNGIRSVILESPLPPQVNYDELGVDGIVYSLNKLFSNCRAEANCKKAYPDLEKEFYSAVAELNKRPVTAPGKDNISGETFNVLLNGDDLVTWIIDYFLSNEAAAIADVPMIIHQIFGKDYTIFKRYAGDKVNPSSNSWGMRYSIWCSEEMPFENIKKIKEQSTRYSGLQGYEVMALPDICSVWKVPAGEPVENKPVASGVPALVLTAEYDAYTPPAWGKETASYLKNSFLVEVPWTGHGPGFSVSCVRDLIAGFLNDPGKAPDASCGEKVKKAFKFTVKSP